LIHIDASSFAEFEIFQVRDIEIRLYLDRKITITEK